MTTSSNDWNQLEFIDFPSEMEQWEDHWPSDASWLDGMDTDPSLEFFQDFELNTPSETTTIETTTTPILSLTHKPLLPTTTTTLLGNDDDDDASYSAILAQVEQCAAGTVKKEQEKGTQKREWDSWNNEEQHKFFAAVKKMPSIRMKQSNERYRIISKKIRTKTTEQVRHFYYRLLRRINELLKPHNTQIDVKNYDEIRIGFMCWYQSCLAFAKPGREAITVRLDNVVIRKRFSSKMHLHFQKVRKSFLKKKSTMLSRQMNQPSSEICVPLVVPTPVVSLPPVKRKRKISIDVLNLPALSPKEKKPVENVVVSSPSGSVQSSNNGHKSDGSSPKITVRFVPMDKHSQRILHQAGCRTQIELRLSSNSKISYVWEHLTKKWQAATTYLEAGSVLRFVPVGNRQHPGWGSDDISVSCADIARQLRRNRESGQSVITLEYKWEKRTVLEEDQQYLLMESTASSPCLSTICEVGISDFEGTPATDILLLPEQPTVRPKARRRITPTLVLQ